MGKRFLAKTRTLLTLLELLNKVLVLHSLDTVFHQIKSACASLLIKKLVYPNPSFLCLASFVNNFQFNSVVMFVYFIKYTCIQSSVMNFDLNQESHFIVKSLFGLAGEFFNLKVYIVLLTKYAILDPSFYQTVLHCKMKYL
jgi:hypothetical protein